MSCDHRQVAVQAFNDCWKLIEEPASKKRDDDLERTAFASLYHWSKVGDAKNLAIGEWMIAHAYLTIGRLEEAARFSQRIIDLCESEGLEDFYLAYGYLEMARVERAKGNQAQAEEWLAKAKSIPIPDEEDREVFEKDLVGDAW